MKFKAIDIRHIISCSIPSAVNSRSNCFNSGKLLLTRSDTIVNYGTRNKHVHMHRLHNLMLNQTEK